MRFLVRLIGVVLFAAAFVTVVIDGTRSIAGNGLVMSSLEQSIALLWPATAARLPGMFGPLWDPAGAWLMRQPAGVVLGLTGMVLMLIGRKRREVMRPLPRRY